MESAMSELADQFDFTIRWEPFLLRPDTPPEGRPLPAMYSEPNNPRVAHMREAAKAVGLDFGQRSMVPNTVKAHALLEYAKTKDGGSKQNETAEKLFKAVFSDGKLLSDDDLVAVAMEVGFDEKEVKNHINDEKVQANVTEKAQNWSRKGINGVPFFYMNGNRMFSGAQDTEVFKRMFQIAVEKFPLETTSRT